MDQWLVRTARNRITGPFSREHILQLIKKAQITAEDEVCMANHYWFYLHEDEEVLRQLGIEITQTPITVDDDDDDVTVTQTQAVEQDGAVDEDEEDTDSGEDLLVEKDVPELAEVSDSLIDETAMITNRALREYQPKKKPATQIPVGSTMASKTPVNVLRPSTEASHYKPVVLGKIEKASFWRGFAMAMAGVVFLLVGIVIYVLRKG